MSHVFSRFSVCSCDYWPQFSMNPYVYLTGFVWCPFKYSTGPCGYRMGLAIPFGQSCEGVRGNTGPVGHTSMGALRNQHDSLWPKIVGSPCLKVVHAHLSATDYTAPVRVQTSSKKSCRLTARSSSQSDQSFRYALNW